MGNGFLFCGTDVEKPTFSNEADAKQCIDFLEYYAGNQLGSLDTQESDDGRWCITYNN